MEITDTPSAPSWAVLFTDDLDAARRFYGGLFGWQARTERTERTEGQQADGYTVFSLAGDVRVGAAAPLADAGKGAAAGWVPYIQCDGLAAVTSRIEADGGRITRAVGPSPIEGRDALAADPDGAAFGVWRPEQHAGFGVVNAPGSFTWFELSGADPARAVDFYQSVFGWGADHEPDGSVRWTDDGSPFGGLRAERVAGAGARWVPVVAVADAEAAVRTATGLGGRVLHGPQGGEALLADPTGAVIAVRASAR